METTPPNRPRELNVGCAGNAKYALPMAVMLTSVVCNAKTDRDIHIYIIESDMTDAIRQKVENSVLRNKKNFHQVVFHWTKLDQFQVYDLPATRNVAYLSSDSYSRLLMPSLLPAEAKQLIYLDADMVVVADLGVLSDSAPADCVLSAVPSITLTYVSTVGGEGKPVVFNYAELGIPSSNRYFNSGVLVINLDAWRQEQVTSRVLDYLERYKNEVILHDQGGLNAIVHDRWHPLDQRWNQTNMVLFPEWWPTPLYSRKDWLRTRNDPFIVHYSGPEKPWQPRFRQPRLSFFTTYLKKTLFKNDAPHFSLESIIGYKTYFFLWSLKRSIHRFIPKWKARSTKPPPPERLEVAQLR